MSTTFHLRVWTRFLAPLDDVWALKTDPFALAAELRPQLGLSLTDDDALARVRAGQAPADLQASLRLGGLPPGVAWPIHVESIVPRVRYRTTSKNALFARYEHDHLFEETPDGARYVDAITFTSTAPAQKLFAILTKRLFEHRHRVAAGRLPTDPQATGVSVLRVLVEAEEEQERRAG
jgi:ligand-binding SRPBCC domain-containing protein